MKSGVTLLLVVLACAARACADTALWVESSGVMILPDRPAGAGK